MPQPDRIIRQTASVEAARLSYLEAGPLDARSILFLHGMPASAELWRDVFGEAACSGFRALAPDGDHSLTAAHSAGTSGRSIPTRRWRQIGG